MSIADVVQYQKDYLAHQTAMGIPVDQQSAAVGAYQMLYPDKAAKELGIDMSAKFDQATQDKLAEYYLNMAGQQDYLEVEKLLQSNIMMDWQVSLLQLKQLLEQEFMIMMD